MKYKYYDVCLTKDGLEWFYTADNLNRVQELINWAIERNQEIKYIKGRVR